jgi:hypothetical protein
MSRRPLVPLAALTAALALAVPGAVAADTVGSGIELARGSGRAVLSLRGALLGGLEQGRITVTRIPGRQRPEIIVQGFEWQRLVDERTTVYGGDGIRFRVFRGAWRVRIHGVGINASAVGSGTVGLRGTGLYPLAGGPYLPWPAEFATVRLGD